MNAQRRKAIAEAAELLEQARVILDQVEGEEREAYENLPTGLQEAERGQALNDAADALAEAVSTLEDVAAGLGDL